MIRVINKRQEKEKSCYNDVFAKRRHVFHEIIRDIVHVTPLSGCRWKTLSDTRDCVVNVVSNVYRTTQTMA